MRSWVYDESGVRWSLPELVWMYDIDPAGKTDEQLVDEVNSATQPMRDWFARTSDAMGRLVDDLLRPSVEDLRAAEHPLCQPSVTGKS